MKLLRILYLLFAVMLFTTSCSRTNDRLLQAEQLIESSPDSAMAILQKYNYNSLTDREKALYGLVYVQILDKKFLALEPDSLLDFSINYFQDKHDDNERLAACYLYRGRDLKYTQHFEKAMVYYLKALEISTNNLLLGRVNFDVGYIYNLQRDHALARRKFILSYQQFILSKSKPLAFNSILFLGRTYFEEKQYNKALIFYNKYKFIVSNSDEKDILWQEIALNYYKINSYDSALFYLRDILNYETSNNNKSIRYLMMADLFYDMNKIDSAELYALKSLKEAIDIRTKKSCYRVLVNCNTLKGDIQKLNVYMSKYQDCNDSLRIVDSQTKGSYIENMHNTQKEVAKSHSWIWYLSVFVLLIIVFSIILYIRKHKKNVLEMKIAQEKQLQQKAELRQEVVAKSRKAVETTIKERRDEVMSNLKNNNPEFRRKLLNKLYGEVIHFNDKIYFKKEMDAIMNSLYSKLESRYPELKEKEIQWACLYELNVSRDDIMDLLDFNLESYKKMRQRFAQKTGVQYIKSIDDLLENILTE